MNTMTQQNTASQKQIDFIKRLVAEREIFDYDPENAAANVVAAQDQPEAYVAGVTVALGRQMWRQGLFDKQAASTTIEALLAAPEKPKRRSLTAGLPEGDPSADAGNDRTFEDANPGVDLEVPAGPAEEGMHQIGETIYKVQRAVNGSGRLYAKVLRQDPGFESWSFEYAPGAMRLLSSETKMSLAAAKAFGVLYGTCCACGRTLTNEDSIAAGIGPICADKF